MLSASKKRGKSKQQVVQATVSSDSGATASSVDSTGQSSGTVKIALNFKRYVFDPNKRMIQ